MTPREKHQHLRTPLVFHVHKEAQETPRFPLRVGLLTTLWHANDPIRSCNDKLSRAIHCSLNFAKCSKEGFEVLYLTYTAQEQYNLCLVIDTKLCIECLFGLSLWRSKGLFSSSGFLKKTLCRHPNVRAFIKVPCSFIIS